MKTSIDYRKRVAIETTPQNEKEALSLAEECWALGCDERAEQLLQQVNDKSLAGDVLLLRAMMLSTRGGSATEVQKLLTQAEAQGNPVAKLYNCLKAKEVKTEQLPAMAKDMPDWYLAQYCALFTPVEEYMGPAPTAQEAEQLLQQAERDAAAAIKARKDEAERKAQEEAERQVKAEAERKAKEEAERKAAEEKKRREEEAKRKAEAERKAKEEAERKAKEEAARKAAADKARIRNCKLLCTVTCTAAIAVELLLVYLMWTSDGGFSFSKLFSWSYGFISASFTIIMGIYSWKLYEMCSYRLKGNSTKARLWTRETTALVLDVLTKLIIQVIAFYFIFYFADTADEKIVVATVAGLAVALSMYVGSCAEDSGNIAKLWETLAFLISFFGGRYLCVDVIGVDTLAFIIKCIYAIGCLFFGYVWMKKD